MNDSARARQDIILTDRERLKITGVEDVSSFDDTCILLKSVTGTLSVDGEGLHITALSVEDGEIEVEGRISGLLFYDEAAKGKRGLFGAKR